MKENHTIGAFFKFRIVFLVVALGMAVSILSFQIVNKYLVSQNLTYGDLPIIQNYFPSQKIISVRITEQVLPKMGYQSHISLGDAIPQLVENGVIDRSKLDALYQSRGGLTPEQKSMLEKPSTTPLVVTQQNSGWLVNMLWPLGLANKMAINSQSPIAGENVGNYASTGGWNLGKETNGGVYFNKFSVIQLTSEQESHVKALAETIYRPCCNNSSFFQDCNHGSAAMALIELGVKQGVSDTEIYKDILAFNSYWFPQNYVETALYLKKTSGADWNNVDPKLILSKDYSSISGWIKNIDTPAQKITGLLPTTPNGGSCGT